MSNYFPLLGTIIHMTQSESSLTWFLITLGSFQFTILNLNTCIAILSHNFLLTNLRLQNTLICNNYLIIMLTSPQIIVKLTHGYPLFYVGFTREMIINSAVHSSRSFAPSWSTPCSSWNYLLANQSMIVVFVDAFSVTLPEESLPSAFVVFWTCCHSKIGLPVN